MPDGKQRDQALAFLGIVLVFAGKMETRIDGYRRILIFYSSNH